ncbi:type VII secretion protein EccE [Nocardia goodfellowii]|uniref:Type VII secretion protein EccE n=1 Tax=Nocardia goodfellowii TaxID=882446 RepID=A0ABS4Q6T4_9NOCA|nr:type VII secretion protein EccE [Nocardia goodfellowii]MBP2187397.1 type VII secretion protein EccE [Nocardia goodfellowii]
MGPTTADGENRETAPQSSPAPSAAPPATPLHSPYFWLFRILPLRWVIPVALVAVLASLVAVIFDASVWIAAGVCAGVLILGLVPLPGRKSLAGWVDEELTFRWRAFRNRSATVNQAPFDVPLPEGGTYGMRWDGARLLIMLRVEAHPRTVTLLSPQSLISDDMMPLPEIAHCLNQFDIELASIDVISTGARTAGPGRVSHLYEQILGPLPAVAHRTVWVVLRLDPLANAAAVARRGGGATGTLRAAIVATRRVANRLAAQGISTVVLSAAEITAAVNQLTRHTPLEEFTETAHSVQREGIHYTTYRMAPEALEPRGFAAVWSTPTLATTVTMRLQRAAHAPREDNAQSRAEDIEVTAVVRFDTRDKPADVRAEGLVPLPGKQFRALLYTLPIAERGRQFNPESYLGKPDSLAALPMPIAGCGQLIGADPSGQGVALPLVGHQVRRVEVIGSLLVAQQMILRAIALGASVVVHTNRHDAWRQMVTDVGVPQSLTVAAWSAAGQQASAHRFANVVVYDGIQPSGHHSDATTVLLRSAPAVVDDHFDPDVTLAEDPETANLVTVRTAGVTTRVHMVATPDEMQYLHTALAAAR